MFDRRLVIASSRIHTCINITCMPAVAVAVGFGTLTDKSGLRKEIKIGRRVTIFVFSFYFLFGVWVRFGCWVLTVYPGLKDKREWQRSIPINICKTERRSKYYIALVLGGEKPGIMTLVCYKPTGMHTLEDSIFPKNTNISSSACLHRTTNRSLKCSFLD